ncbi:MAG: efflux RND transporter periplasmic adaptor subunit, partial [Planctomycetota bacterium]|nr:efflux RND transporter periplasmic adaptor subunit [Planctomycetota bacterium]
GDRVEAGQAVARLISDDAELDVRRARATLDEKRGRVARALAALEAAEVHRRELVEPDLDVKVAVADLARAKAELAGIAPRRAALEATRSEVLDEYERKRKVVESGAVPEGPVIRLGIRIESIDAQLRGLEAEEAAIAARVEAAEAQAWGARRIRELLIAEILAVSSAEAEVEIARGEVEMATVALDRAQLRLDRCTVRTPVAGVVIERLTSPGSKLMFGDGPHTAHVIHLYDPENLQVRADIPLADAARVGVGQRAEIVVDLLPDTVFEGSVTRFVHRADLAKNTVEAKVRIEDPSPLLKPDMLARVRILEAAADDVGEDLRRTDTRVFAPAEAIDGGRVWVVAERDGNRGIARRVGVSIGPKVEDGWVEVLDGLRPGDMVILEDATTEGEAVRIRPEDREVQS